MLFGRIECLCGMFVESNCQLVFRVDGAVVVDNFVHCLVDIYDVVDDVIVLGFFVVFLFVILNYVAVLDLVFVAYLSVLCLCGFLFSVL